MRRSFKKVYAFPLFFSCVSHILILPKGKEYNMLNGVHRMSEAPERCDSQGLLPFYRLAKPSGSAALLSVEPFADVVCDYTCQNGEDKGIQ